MSSDLQKRLADVLSGGNGEAALLMGKRYLSEDTLYWSMGANYERTDNDHAIERFIEAWQSNVDYELVADGAFEGKADIMVEHDSSLDVVKVVLYGAGTEDCEPRLYAELLHNIADWVEKNGETISRRESVTPDLLQMNSDTRSKNEMPDWLAGEYKVTLTQQTFTPKVVLKPGPTGNTLSAMPGEDLTPEAKVLFDEIVSNFEDWLHGNDLEPWEIVMAATAAQSYMTGRAGGIIAVE